jgi:hypothetical protein
MKFKERDRGRSLWVRDFTSHRHGVRLDWARRSQGGALVAKVLIEVHKMLIKVLIGREMSTLEKLRVSLQGAQGAQGAHPDLSTLGRLGVSFGEAQFDKVRPPFSALPLSPLNH